MNVKRSCCNLHQTFLSIFSSKCFIVSGLTFRSLIHFEFIFVYGVKKCSNFIFFFFFFTHGCPLFPAPFTEEAVFSPLYIFPFFVKDKVPLSGWIYLWAFCLVLLIYISGFFANIILSWLLWLCSIVWSKEGWFLQPLFFFVFFFLFFSFLSNALANQGLLCFHTTCNTFHSSSVKNTMVIW